MSFVTYEHRRLCRCCLVLRARHCNRHPLRHRIFGRTSTVSSNIFFNFENRSTTWNIYRFIYFICLLLTPSHNAKLFFATDVSNCRYQRNLERDTWLMQSSVLTPQIKKICLGPVFQLMGVPASLTPKNYAGTPNFGIPRVHLTPKNW